MSMRLSTSTNIMDRYKKVQSVVSMEECLKRCARAGYKVMDMNFCDMSHPNMPLTKGDWEAWIEHIALLAESLNVTFSQSHSHFYNFLDSKIENREWHEEMVRRSIIASGKLNVKWMTMHAGTDFENGFSAVRSKRGNIEYFNPHIELAVKYNVGVVIENMYDPSTLKRTYTATTEDLIDLVDSFNDPRVGICWDFGHANLVGVDQCISLRQVGKRLKSTHFNDNHGERDEHLLPFYGNIEWEQIMKTLKEIDYEYDLTYEITPFLDRVPPQIRDTALVHTVEVGNYLIGLFQKS